MVADSQERLRRMGAALILAEARLGKNHFDIELRRTIGTLYLRKARLSEDAADYRAAEKQFRAVVSLDGTDGPARIGLARALAGRYRFGEALVQAREAAVYSDRPQNVIELLGDIHFAVGNYLEAATAYRRLLADGNSLGSLARMALVHEARGRDERAEVMLTQACQAGRSQNPDVADLVWCAVARGQLALSRGRLAQAERRFARALAIDPSSAEAAWGKARVSLRQGRHEAAERDLLALTQRFLRPRFLETLAVVLDAVGKNEAAASARKLAREKLAAQFDAGNRRVIGAYAESLLLPDGDARLALKTARREVEQVRHDTEAYATLAWALYHRQRFDDALSAIERALASGSSNPLLAARAGIIYAAAGRRAQAQTYLTRALVAPTALPPALARQATALVGQAADQRKRIEPEQPGIEDSPPS